MQIQYFLCVIDLGQYPQTQIFFSCRIDWRKIGARYQAQMVQFCVRHERIMINSFFFIKFNYIFVI
jgi:hypothetical protein